MNASGGGITCSGGEAMLQPEFVRDFFRAAKAEGIHTCLDTNGYVRKFTPVIDEVLEVTDLVMLDIKQMDDEIHQDLIGVSNKRTLDFARYLHQIGQKLGCVTWWFQVTPMMKHLLINWVSLLKTWKTSRKLSCCLTTNLAHTNGKHGRRISTGRRESAKQRNHG